MNSPPKVSAAPSSPAGHAVVRTRAAWLCLLVVATSCRCHKRADEPDEERRTVPVVTMAGAAGFAGAAGSGRVATSGAGGASCDDVVIANEQPSKQTQTLWCWAATAQNITGIEQCKFASDVLAGSSTDCCADPAQPGCNNENWPLFTRQKHSVTIRTNDFPALPQLRAEVSAKRAFAITEEYPRAQGAHMFTVVGFARVGERDFAELFDPAAEGTFWWRDYGYMRTEDATRIMSRTYYQVQAATNPTCFTEQGSPSCGSEPQRPSNPPVSTSIPAPKPECVFETPQPTALEAAQKGLETVRRLGAKHPKSLGFQSAEEAGTAQLTISAVFAAAEPVFDGPANTLSTVPLPSPYLYRIDDRPGGLIVVAPRTGGTWQAVEYGGSPIALGIDAVEKLLAGSPPTPVPAGTLRRGKLLVSRTLSLYLLEVKLPNGVVTYRPTRNLGPFSLNTNYPPDKVSDQLRKFPSGPLIRKRVAPP